jgi:metallophosphoesterase superfamily enzyme
MLFCGDPHGQFAHIIEAVQEHCPAAVILLGDMQAQRPLEVELTSILDKTEIWFIHGNHDAEFGC